MDRKSLIEPWRVVGHRYSYRDRWLRLRSDRCVTPAGQDVDPFHVLEYHDWINVLALTGGNRCLLVRECRHGVGEIVVGLPGGTMDATDADPETAARRELLEETGFTAGSLIPCGTSFANAATHTNRVWSYIAPDAVRTGGQSLDET